MLLFARSETATKSISDVSFVCKDGRVQFNKIVLSTLTSFETTFLSTEDDVPLQILTPDYDAKTVQVK